MPTSPQISDFMFAVFHKYLMVDFLFLFLFFLQVSDFGLAKLALDANTHVTTRVMGTFG